MNLARRVFFWLTGRTAGATPTEIVTLSASSHRTVQLTAARSAVVSLFVASRRVQAIALMANPGVVTLPATARRLQTVG